MSALTGSLRKDMPREALTGLTSFEVAVPAALLPRRGIRARQERCRRWNLGHAQISVVLVRLMFTIPCVVRFVDVGSN